MCKVEFKCVSCNINSHSSAVGSNSQRILRSMDSSLKGSGVVVVLRVVVVVLVGAGVVVVVVLVVGATTGFFIKSLPRRK